MKPVDKVEIEKLARELMRMGSELEKVEFKRWTKDGDLAKEISAIANTDGEDGNVFLKERLGGDFGMLLLGVSDNGEIVGIPREDEEETVKQNWKTGWAFQKSDNGIVSTLQSKLEEYVYPVPQFTVFSFEEEGKRWLVVLIFPSEKQPHVMTKQAGDGNYREGDWYVKSGPNVVRASYVDYDRVMEKRARRLLNPIEEKLEGLAQRVDRELGEAFAFVVQLRSFLAERGVEMVVERFGLSGAPSHRLRALRRSKEPVHRAVEEAFDEFQENLRTLQLPWHSENSDPDTVRKWIEKAENATYEVVSVAGEAVALDEKGDFAERLVGLMEEAAEDQMSRRGNVINVHWEGLQHYPFALLTYAVAVTALAYERASYFSAMRGAKLDLGFYSEPKPWLPEVINKAVDADALFRVAWPTKRLCDPMTAQSRTVLFENPGLVREVLPRRSSRYRARLFRQAEILLSMLSVKNTGGGTYGEYLYVRGGEDHLCELLMHDRQLLATVFDGQELDSARALWKFADQKKREVLGPCPASFAGAEPPECLKEAVAQ
ncbi:ATP-binding protein [Oceanithermus sp.]|uniref:AlbA family DNA-binding domain-containing protein n=1 Tax=Oceanithermus sp. TaxID=2268145 RepID=UPI00257ED53D|nr:ATP-binding protein [Oceanithermus sp.]